MILLDTNVISELVRERPDKNVVVWMDVQPREELYLCAPVVAELFYGIGKLPESRRKRNLARLIGELALKPFRDRILPFDAPAAEIFGSLVANRQRIGRPIQVTDAMIAAIALHHGARVATRNTSHFEQLGLDLLDPFR